MKRLTILGLAIALASIAFVTNADLVANTEFVTNADLETANHELRTLAQYPRDVREAMLELLNHPKLLMQLTDGNDLEKTAKGQAPMVANAARLVAKYPNVLKLLRDHPETLEEAGKAYAEDKKKAIEFMNRDEKEHNQATKDWSLRLEGDQVALEQLQAVAVALAKQSGTSPMDVGFQLVAEDVNVFSLPTPVVINYVMTNADVYPALANVMVSQWLSSSNWVSYDRTYYHWWNRYHHYFHDSLLRPDAERFHRLSEIARFDRAFAHMDAAHRWEKFHEHAGEFSHLAKHHRMDMNRKALALHEKPHHKDPHAPGKDPHKPGHKGKHTKVHHKTPGHQHHMHHAHTGHQHHVQHHAGHGHKGLASTSPPLDSRWTIHYTQLAYKAYE